ncbi:MAG: hypothetical protein ACREUT_11710 [Steroidobacteraceae bacterium]
MAGERLGEALFGAHVELLQSFLAHRGEIVEELQALLNAQRQPAPYLQDASRLSRDFEDRFFALTAIGRDHSRLRGELQKLHWASGFTPRRMPGVHNDLVDPAEMMMRALHFWRSTRWPGRNGRIRYAHTLFNLYVLRSLELLSMRLWDAGPASAGERLSQLQGVLERLWRSSPPGQPVFVRDARWLVPLALSPTTDELGPYFEVAERVSETFSDADRMEICRASVQTAGGHLRSQLRHCSIEKGVPIDENALTLSTRNSNALDFAMLIQALVPLLEAYEHATQNGERHARLESAAAICQGISADPELFVNRIDLLGAYSMIEPLFITTDRQGHAVLTPMGRRHVRLLQEYRARIRRVSNALYEDCSHFRPVAGAYSPYGVIYGFSSNLTEHIGFKSLQPEAASRFSVEDVFAEGNASEKLAWVSGWRKLPHIDEEVQRLFDYPQRFAEQIFDRIEHALHRGAADGEASAAARTGRLFLAARDDPQAGSSSSTLPIPELPARYIGSSDMQRVGAHQAHSYDPTRLLRDRNEGMFLVSFETPGGWTAITKDILTEILGAGCDVKILGLPSVAVEALGLMCPDLVVLPEKAACAVAGSV